MTTHNSGDPSEQLRELLRRMEQIPDEETPPGRDTEAANPPAPFLAGFGLQLRREHAVQLTVVAIGTAAALAAGWALLFGRPSATSAAAERQPAPVAAPQPARPADAPYRLAAASETILPRSDSGATIEARAQSSETTPAPAAPRPSLVVPAITATSGERARFAVRVEPSSAAIGGAQMHVYGLPRGARFSAGNFVAPDHWVIPIADTGALDLAAGDGVEGRFDLTIELHGADGRQLTATTSRLTVTAPPASAPQVKAATAAPVARPAASADEKARVAAAASAPVPLAALGDAEKLDEQTQDKFLIQGLRFLVIGNINSARLLFERAADAGNARAALLMGDTFDDVRLTQLGVLGVVPDRARSVYWYERADELGAPEAKERLSELNLR
jgi:TPR repeat protein